ncbi:uncharacterized protein LOC119683950 [Teleopsis dalmanni]|uniref:uncharacterized protein LOC119677512 n=1 Tax=Teleopsis dalmanni TaxID=139649 RepID=UPI0018CFD65D|nr:uncharacterized protein LOC119677512 [Teleopsis dalmanni]XP_037944819.1 uncharacterized protein LOC119677514 [Teleopsis dalmanni]XP_037953768.1 uncharacterized protein LOC119683944 [Teleopsis dalmanni]XP_037953774.1 uncharacterized protein LOC119683950 [Teleopsis dalmanni]
MPCILKTTQLNLAPREANLIGGAYCHHALERPEPFSATTFFPTYRKVPLTLKPYARHDQPPPETERSKFHTEELVRISEFDFRDYYTRTLVESQELGWIRNSKVVLVDKPLPRVFITSEITRRVISLSPFLSHEIILDDPYCICTPHGPKDHWKIV